jgi:hypothetical protein
MSVAPRRDVGATSTFGEGARDTSRPRGGGPFGGSGLRDTLGAAAAAFGGSGDARAAFGGSGEAAAAGGVAAALGLDPRAAATGASAAFGLDAGTAAISGSAAFGLDAGTAAISGSAAFGLDAGTAAISGSAAFGLDAGTAAISGSAAFGLDAGTSIFFTTGAGAVVTFAVGDGVSVAFEPAGVASMGFAPGAGAARGTVTRGTPAPPGLGVAAGFAPSFGSSVHGSGRFDSIGESFSGPPPPACFVDSCAGFAADMASGVVVGDAGAILGFSDASLAAVGSGVPVGPPVAALGAASVEGAGVPVSIFGIPIRVRPFHAGGAAGVSPVDAAGVGPFALGAAPRAPTSGVRVLALGTATGVAVAVLVGFVCTACSRWTSGIFATTAGAARVSPVLTRSFASMGTLEMATHSGRPSRQMIVSPRSSPRLSAEAMSGARISRSSSSPKLTSQSVPSSGGDSSSPAGFEAGSSSAFVTVGCRINTPLQWG